MSTILTLGDIVAEFAGVELDQKFSETKMFEGPFPSGCSAIFADQVARFGVSAGVIAKIGRDGFGELNINRLKADNVDVEGIVYSDTTNTGTNLVTYNSDGSRQFIMHYGNGAMGELRPEEVNEEMFKDCQYFHTVGSAFIASENLWLSTCKGIEYAKKYGAKITTDPNVRPELAQPGVFEKYLYVLEQSDIFLGSIEEILTLAELDDIEEALASERFRDKEIIAIKNGAKSTRVIYPGGQCVVPSFKVTEVDPTGAGDCWDAAFLACLAKGHSYEEAATIAMGAGALSVTKMGAMGGHFKEEVLQFMKTAERNAL